VEEGELLDFFLEAPWLVLEDGKHACNLGDFVLDFERWLFLLEEFLSGDCDLDLDLDRRFTLCRDLCDFLLDLDLSLSADLLLDPDLEMGDLDLSLVDLKNRIKKISQFLISKKTTKINQENQKITKEKVTQNVEHRKVECSSLRTIN
jgi:hypothetical protein